MTGPNPLLRLADELGELGRRLEVVGSELRLARTEGWACDAFPARPGRPDAGVPQDTARYTAVQAPLQPAPQQVFRPAPPPMPVVQSPPVVIAPPPPPPVAPPQAWVPMAPVPAPAPSMFERLSRDGAGSRLLAWVGGAITLLGVVMLLVLAVQRDYFGPLHRVLGGAVLGLALIAIGLRMHRTPTARTGAFAVAATGIAAIYLDVIAATSLYGYLPTGAGLVLGLLVAAGGLVLAMRWNSALLAIGVVLACAVCAPVITAGFTPLLVAFLLVLKAASAPVHLRREWPGLALAAGVPPLVASLITQAVAPGTGDGLAAATVALTAAAVGVGLAVVTVHRRPDDVVALGLLVSSPIPAMLATPLVERTLAAGLAGIITLLMLGVWATGRGVLPARFATAAGAVGVVALFQTTAIALDGTARSAAVLTEAVFLAYLTSQLRSKGSLLAAGFFGFTGLLMTVVLEVPPHLLLDVPGARARTMPGDLVAGLITAALLGLVAVALPWAAARAGVLPKPGKLPVPWVLAGVVVLYAAAGVVLCGALLISPDRTGFLFGHSVVTVSWTIAALVLLVRGIDVLPLRVSGLVLVGAAVAKLVLFDLAALDGIARVTAFLGAGLILLGAGTRYAKLVASRRIPVDVPRN